MTARVLESLEETDSAAFSTVCESLWGNELPPATSSEEDPTTSTEVSHLIYDSEGISCCLTC